jgi:hypothetical protein
MNCKENTKYTPSKRIEITPPTFLVPSLCLWGLSVTGVIGLRASSSTPVVTPNFPTTVTTLGPFNRGVNSSGSGLIGNLETSLVDRCETAAAEAFIVGKYDAVS